MVGGNWERRYQRQEAVPDSRSKTLEGKKENAEEFTRNSSPETYPTRKEGDDDTPTEGEDQAKVKPNQINFSKTVTNIRMNIIFRKLGLMKTKDLRTLSFMQSQ